LRPLRFNYSWINGIPLKDLKIFQKEIFLSAKSAKKTQGNSFVNLCVLCGLMIKVFLISFTYGTLNQQVLQAGLALSYPSLALRSGT
jgi:hypothetical protein